MKKKSCQAPVVEQPKRVIVQLVVVPARSGSDFPLLYALCSDHSVWVMNAYGGASQADWARVKDIDQGNV